MKTFHLIFVVTVQNTSNHVNFPFKGIYNYDKFNRAALSS